MTQPFTQTQLREEIAREVSEWESFVAGDGCRSIRQRDARTPQQTADAVLALPAVRALLDAQAALGRVQALADRLDKGHWRDSDSYANAIRAALRGDR